MCQDLVSKGGGSGSLDLLFNLVLLEIHVLQYLFAAVEAVTGERR